jgi:N-acetylmuramoyl-L-alanine amidase
MNNIRISWRVLFCALLLLFPYLAYAASARVIGFHLSATGGKTHLVIDMVGTQDYKAFALANPNRLVIDFPGAHLATGLHGNFNKSSIKEARSGYPQPGTLRIVFDLRKPVRHTISLQKSDNKAVLVIDLYDPSYRAPVIKKEKKPIPTPQTPPAKTSTQQKSTPTDENSMLEQDMLQQVLDKQTPQATKQAPAKAATSAKNTSVMPLAIPPETTATSPSTALPTPVATANNQRVINIIIDPGHGGKDPGTAGHFGVREKDVVLAIGLDLYQLLQKDPRFHAVMTRNRDYFLTLRQRLTVARKNHGDVFIAIHADAFKDPFATGASIYALSPHGASSEAALWLAKKENYSELGGINLDDKSDLLRSVLIDLSQTATVSSSLQLGQDLLNELGRVGKLHHSTVEQAPFMVLKSPDIPSVLIETGFLSNPSEEERLRNPIYQQQIAQAVYTGLLDYFMTNPAAGKQIVNTKNK